MTLTDFKATLTDGTPPGDLGLPLQALWYAANDSWDAAHKITQDEGDPQLDWVHAYLHRVEGDESNAAYWYRRARQARLQRLARRRVERDHQDAAGCVEPI